MIPLLIDDAAELRKLRDLVAEAALTGRDAVSVRAVVLRRMLLLLEAPRRPLIERGERLVVENPGGGLELKLMHMPFNRAWVGDFVSAEYLQLTDSPDPLGRAVAAMRRALAGLPTATHTRG